MTESNLGPATPGTAARCEICGFMPTYEAELASLRTKLAAAEESVERLKAETASLREERDEARAAIDGVTEAADKITVANMDVAIQLRAAEKQNASLLESLRATKINASWAEDALEKAKAEWRAAEQRAEAAEKRAIGLIGVLREIHKLIGVVRSDYHEYEAEKRIEDLCVAALHDEERLQGEEK